MRLGVDAPPACHIARKLGGHELAARGIRRAAALLMTVASGWRSRRYGFEQVEI